MDFDAVITLNDYHLAAAGLSDRKTEAVADVRKAVEHFGRRGLDEDRAPVAKQR